MVKAEIRAEAEMKDSGIEWVGKIPKHCGITQIKRFFHVQAGGDAKPEYYAYEKDEVHKYPVYTNSANKNQIYAYTSKPIFDKGTITVAGRGTLGVAFLRDTPYDAIIRLLSVSARDKSKVVPKFWEYWFNATNVTLDIQTTVGQLSAKQFEVKPAIVMPVEEQRAIAAYLDKVCGTIDEIMAEARASIEEYKQLKQSVIFEAVTKGLDKNAATKDSGVEWIGKISKNAVVKKIKYTSNISRGLFTHRPRDAAFLYDGTHPFIQTGDVARANKYITEFRQTLSDAGTQVSKCFPKGTLTMTIAANVGDVSILGFDAYFPDSVLGITPYDNYSSEYLYYIFTSMKNEFVRVASSNTQLNLNVERVKELFVPIFEDVNIQREIVRYLNDKINAMDSLISEKTVLISDLASYKKSLIYELVTGKRRVV